MRRAIKIEGIDKELELSRAVRVKTTKSMIHFDQLKDGTWRLTYSANVIPDFSKVKSLKIIRED